MASRGENGGHSTKAKGFDKRKNEYKEVLKNALTFDDLTGVIKMLFNKSVKDKDVNASKILLEYYLGKPTQTIEQNNTHTLNEGFDIRKLYDREAQE